MVCQPDRKFAILVNFIKQKGFDLKYMLFLSSCACVDYFYSVLRNLLPEINFYALHGKMKSKRSTIFGQFRNIQSGK